MPLNCWAPLVVYCPGDISGQHGLNVDCERCHTFLSRGSPVEASGLPGLRSGVRAELHFDAVGLLEHSEHS